MRMPMVKMQTLSTKIRNATLIRGLQQTPQIILTFKVCLVTVSGDLNVKLTLGACHT